MERIKQILWCCLLTAALAWGSWLTVQAQEITKTLMDLTEPSDMVVWIYYEEGEPSAVITAPDGTEYSEALGNVRVERGETSIYFYLPDSQPGHWTIRYDDRVSGNVQITCTPYTESISISSFTAEEAGNNQVRARFQADYPSQVTYNYEISAVLTDSEGNVTGERSLETGTARSGEETALLISLDALSAYDGYQLRLDVWYKKYTLETGDSQIAQERFAAGGGQQPESVQGVNVEIDFEKHLVYLDWSEYRVSCDHYVAAVWSDSNTSDEPDEYRTVQPDECRMTATLPEDCSSIMVELTYVQSNGTASQTYRRDIPLDQAECSMQTEENTASAQAVIRYRMPGRIPASLQVNQSTQSLYLENEGDFSANLEEGRNEMILTCSLDEMTDFVYRFQIYSDRIAPILNLYEEIDGICVDSSSFLLTGETEEGCVLTVNGKEEILAGDGTFQVELPLKKGENPIEIQVTDPAGNQTRQSAVIFRGTLQEAAEAFGKSEGSTIEGSYGPLLLTAWLSIMAALMAVIGLLIAGRKPGNRLSTAAGTARNLFFLFALFSGTACGWFWLQAGRAGEAAVSQEFLEAAETSVSAAYELLKQGEHLRSWMFMTAVSTLVLLIWGVMAWLLKLTAKRRQSALEQGRRGNWLSISIVLFIMILFLVAGILALYRLYGEIFWK